MQRIGFGDVMEGEHGYLSDGNFEQGFLMFLLVGRNNFLHALKQQ